MAQAGHYDALEPRPPSPYHDASLSHNSPAASNLPLEDLDYDLPPGAVRPRFYNSDFGGPEPRQSYADSFDGGSTRQPSIANPSFTALPLERGSGYGPSPLNRQYRDDPYQASATPPDSTHDFRSDEKRAMYAGAGKRRRRTWLLVAGIGLVVVALIGAGVGIYFAVAKPGSKKSGTTGGSSSSGDTSSTSGDGSKPSGGTKNLAAVSGGDGSKVTADDGSTFTYQNSFGGFWYQDPQSPFAGNAQPNSWTPPINQTWRWGQDRIYGVNLGGWLNTEPFIAPALYEKYSSNPTPPIDEWTLSEAMAADGGVSQLENHYKTFITEQDFAEIAAAGLNWVRIPLPYWAIETKPGEPFLEGVAWKYFLKAINWARKYGIRINLDLHALPGSQNGWNHSGRLGTINVLNGVMGLANAQRSLTYIRVLAEFISQPQYSDVIQMFGITNEPQASVVGMDVLSSYYLEAYNVVREASGTGAGKGPMIAFHDGFSSLTDWAGFLPNADRIALDTHPYFAFGGQSTAPISSFAQQACDAWGGSLNTSMANFGMTSAGEFSLATNDCGLFVNGVGQGTRYEGTFVGGPGQSTGSCDQWDNWESYTQDTKNQLKTFAVASMDALQNWFFWNWKIGNSTQFQSIRAPFWSYQLGLAEGWIPQDPRTASGSCQQSSPWVGPLQPWQTGGAGAGSIDPSATASLAWPPPAISNAGPASVLPTYTPTGPVPTLPAATFTADDPKTTFDAGKGWVNAADTASAYVAVAGCSYPDPWSGVGAPVPTAPCTGGAAPAAAARRAVITPVP